MYEEYWSRACENLGVSSENKGEEQPTKYVGSYWGEPETVSNEEMKAIEQDFAMFL